MKAKGLDGKIAVVVGTITDDVRMFEVPALKVNAISLLLVSLYRISVFWLGL